MRNCAMRTDGITLKRLSIALSLVIGPALLAQTQGGLDPTDIMKPLADQWTSYSGDLSGKRFSTLKLVNTNTVKNLSLKWVESYTTGCGPNGDGPAAGAGGGPGAGGGGGGGGRGRGGGGGGSSAPIIVGGLADGSANNCST